jgi:hypothetical protein
VVDSTTNKLLLIAIISGGIFGNPKSGVAAMEFSAKPELVFETSITGGSIGNLPAKKAAALFVPLRIGEANFTKKMGVAVIAALRECSAKNDIASFALHTPRAPIPKSMTSNAISTQLNSASVGPTFVMMK